MTQLSEQLIPTFESSVATVPDRLGVPGVHVGNVVPVDDVVAALPLGPTRRVRAVVAGGADLVLVLALTEPVAAQVRATAGSGDDLAGASLPVLNGIVAAIGTLTDTTLELVDLGELSPTEPLNMPGAQAFTAGLFIGDEQVGNVVLFAMAGAPAPAARPAGVATATSADPFANTVNPLSLLRGVEMRVTAELGRARLPVSHVLDLGPGAVVELDRVAGSPVDVLVNGTVIAHGEVVVIDEEYGVRITEIVGAEDD